MTKNEKELLTDTVRLCCVFNEHDGLNMRCHSGPTPTNCLRTCTKVIEFWYTYRQLKDKEILI